MNELSKLAELKALQHIESNELENAQEIIEKINDIKVQTKLLKRVFDRLVSKIEFMNAAKLPDRLKRAEGIASKMPSFSTEEKDCYLGLANEYIKYRLPEGKEFFDRLEKALGKKTSISYSEQYQIAMTEPEEL